MQNKIVIDTSAVMVLLGKEAGFEIVEKHLNNVIISSVNFSEVLTVAYREIFKNNKEKREGFKLIKNTFPHIIDFDSEQASIAASLDEFTKKYGLSLGDRACLALAKHHKLPILTSDKIWKKLDININIQLIK